VFCWVFFVLGDLWDSLLVVVIGAQHQFRNTISYCSEISSSTEVKQRLF